MSNFLGVSCRLNFFDRWRVASVSATVQHHSTPAGLAVPLTSYLVAGSRGERFRPDG
jgi:hypothetical protein